MTMAELIIQGLGKRYGSANVLENIDLTVASGSLLAILGPSGSGKSTLLRLVCGFERPDTGCIRINGHTVAGGSRFVPPELRHIGYVPQEGALFPHLSVADNITFGLPRAQRQVRHKVAALLERVGLPASFADRHPQALSGGQQQRVALARALAPEPALVLLDEPFSALDAALRYETRQAVADALSAAGATAIMVTHDQSEALSMGRQVAVLWEGKLVQLDTPEGLYRTPASAEIARFIGDAILLAGFSDGRKVRCVLGDLSLLANMPQGQVKVMLRPEQIRILPQVDQAPFRARVAAVTYYGHDAGLCLQMPDGTTLMARVAGFACPSPGSEVGLRVEGDVVAFPARTNDETTPGAALAASSVRTSLPEPTTAPQARALSLPCMESAKGP
jgi:iron(III) transport system ATP-binding protein